MVSLPDGRAVGQIAVAGNDVYVMGLSKTLANYSNIGFIYWKNGVVYPIGNDAIPVTMKLVGNDLYIAGYTASNSQAVYWKNGIKTVLPGAETALDIAVVNSGIYAVGFTSSNHAVYWKNGAIDTLAKGVALSVFVTN